MGKRDELVQNGQAAIGAEATLHGLTVEWKSGRAWLKRDGVPAGVIEIYPRDKAPFKASRFTNGDIDLPTGGAFTKPVGAVHFVLNRRVRMKVQVSLELNEAVNVGKAEVRQLLRVLCHTAMGEKVGAAHPVDATASHEEFFERWKG
jgi:hypothetical protein